MSYNVVEEKEDKKENKEEKAKQKNKSNPFLNIPNDCLYEILLFLSFYMPDVVKISLICKSLNNSYNKIPDNYWKYFTRYHTSKSFTEECKNNLVYKNDGWKGFFKKSYHFLVTKIIFDKTSTFFVRRKVIYVCGDDKYGQLGVGNIKNVSTLTKMQLNFAEDENIVRIITQLDSTFIQTNRGMYVCGKNDCGQLGVGHKKDISEPMKMKLDLAENEIIGKVISNGFSTYIQTNKNVYVCGENIYGQLEVGHENYISKPTKMQLNFAENENIVRIITQLDSTFIQTNRGMYVCGKNDCGQLGVGHKKDISEPMKMKLDLAENEIIGKVISNGFSTYIQTNKNVYVCGNNDYGQLGVEDIKNVLVPKRMKLNLTKDEIIKNVISDGFSTCIQTNKNVYVCGKNDCGQLGVGDIKNVLVPKRMKLNLTKGENIVRIIFKDGSTFIQTSHGMYVCGNNEYGQLGVGHKNNRLKPTKMGLNLANGENIVQIIIQLDSTFIQTNRGMYVCGKNDCGQLGVGHKKDISEPMKMKLDLAENEIIGKVISNGFSTYIQTNKNVYVCGENIYGQLGVGHENYISKPTKMKLNLTKNEIINNVIFYRYSIFIQTNQGIYVCGSNIKNHLGIGCKHAIAKSPKLIKFPSCKEVQKNMKKNSGNKSVFKKKKTDANNRIDAKINSKARLFCCLIM